MSVRNFDLIQKKGAQDSADPQQLTFSDLQFHLPQADFAELPELSDDLWFSLKNLSYRKVSKRYFSFSVMVHALLAWTLLFLNLPLAEKPKIETVTIEIKELSGNESQKFIPQPVQPTKAPVVAAAPVETDSVKSQDLPTKSELPVKVEAPAQKEVLAARIRPSPKAVATPKPAPLSPAAKIKTPAVEEKANNEPVIKLKPVAATAPRPQVVAEESEVSVPTTLDDIKSPTLNDESLNTAQPEKSHAKLNKALETDLNQVDQQAEDLVAQESQQLNQATQNLEEESQENLKAIEAQEKAEQEAVAKANSLRRQKEAQAIAAAKAQEEADAKAVAAAAAAEQAAARQGGNGLGDGEAEQTGAAPGVGEVRSLQQMRQMPGNPKPSYDYQERLRGDAGEVVFLAYVTREGSTGQFKLVKSTGHRNLDLKTLKALKKWKFYPGQEGWVEFPFRWDLSGGPTEMPTLLRRGR